MSMLKIKQIDSAAGGEGSILVKEGTKNLWSSQANGAIVLPAGPTSARPESPSAGMVRQNTDLNLVEGWNGTEWVPLGGGQGMLGDPTDGSLVTSRYSGGKPPAISLTRSDKVVDAIDNINEILGLLLPDAPAAFGGSTLTITGTADHLLATGFTNNSTNSGLSAGATVKRITSSTVSSSTISGLGDGTTGSVSLWKNGTAVVGESVSFTGNPGTQKTSGELRINNNNWTSPPGFFMTFDAAVNGAAVSVGQNDLSIHHSASGNSTLATVVRDDLTTNPTVGTVAVSEGTKTAVKSSGVDHYNTGSTVVASASISGLAGQCYKSGNIVDITGPGTTVSFAPGANGLPSILTANMAPYSMSSVSFAISGNRHTVGSLSVAGSNPNGSGNATSSTKLIVKSGTAGTAVDESGFTALTSSTANRVYLATGTGDTPSSLSKSAWSSSQLLNAAGYTHEASIVGGVISCDKNDYTTGYLPVGPNYSSKDSAQYVTFKVAKSGVAQFTINITGAYSGLWVAMPGISDNASSSPAALGGAWWSAYALYNGAGIPGRSGDATAGCANGAIATGATGAVAINMGAANSTNATGNEILIRIKLAAGQSITALTIS